MKYSGFYLNPFTESKVGAALLFDLSEEANRMFETLYFQFTSPTFVIIFFCIGVVLTLLSEDAPVKLIGRTVRFFIIANLIYPFIMVMLELGCSIGDLLVTNKNYLLNDLSASIIAITKLGKGYKDKGLLNFDTFLLPLQLSGKAGYIILTQIVVRFGMFAVGASFSIMIFFGLVVSIVSCVMSILPTHSKNWQYPLHVGLWAMVTPIVVAILTQLCSFVFAVPTLNGDNTTLAQVLFLVLFVFYIFGAFKMAQSVVRGDGVAEPAAAMGMSAMTGYATGMMVKAASLGKSQLLKAGSYLKGQDSRISNFANSIRESSPRSLHDVATNKFSRSGMGHKENFARAYDNIRHPAKAMGRIREEREIAKNALSSGGFPSKLGREVSQESLSSIDNISLTEFQRARLSPEIHTPLFDRAMSNGVINQSDSYVHDIAKWDSFSSEKKLDLSEKFNVGENSQNGYVYYPKDWGIQPVDRETHNKTLDSINNNYDYIDTDFNQEAGHSKTRKLSSIKRNGHEVINNSVKGSRRY